MDYQLKSWRYNKICSLLLILLSTIQHLCASDIKICDSESEERIANCVAKIYSKDGKILQTLTSDAYGIIGLDSAIVTACDSIRFTHYGYNPLTIASSQIKDKIELIPATRTLNEVTVQASRPLISQKLNAITYHVDSDAAVIDKSLLDAIKRTPFLIITPEGGITTVSGFNGIEYRLNGLDDPLVRENQYNVFSSIPARNISHIDVSEVFTSDGIKLRINIVTKGRLEGVNGSLSTSINDNRWTNSIFLLTKVRRWAISASYSNNWMWGHRSTETSEEIRQNNALLHHIYSTDITHGYKSDNHTISFSTSYIPGDRTVIAAFGTVWLKTDPHSYSSGAGLIKNQESTPLMRYSYNETNRPSSDTEYNLGASLQHTLASGGIFTGKYQYYRRRFNGHETRKYDLEASDSLINKYRELYPDFTFLNSRALNIHTLRFNFDSPMSHNDKFRAEAQARYYLDSDDTHNCYTTAESAYETQGDFRHNQLYAYLRGEYTRQLGKSYAISIAANVSFYDNIIKSNGIRSSRRFFNVSPIAYVSAMPSRKTRLDISYEMSHMMPSANALDPYRDYKGEGMVVYGNPNLAPEKRNQINLRFTLFLGNNMLQLTSANRFSSDLMLRTVFLSGSMLHSTVKNAASCIENSLSAYFQHRSRRLFFKVFSSANYVNYNSYNRLGIGAGNHGWYWNNQAAISYEIGRGWSMECNLSAHTRYVYFQGYGDANYMYGVSVTKLMMNNKLRLTAFCQNPIPVHKTIYNHRDAAGYAEWTKNRSFTALFGLQATLRFGNLRANVKGDHRTINNTDLKSSYER